jgi:hypothetical protein
MRGEDHVGLVVVASKVVDGHDVGVVAEPAHGLGLSHDAGAGDLVEAIGLDQGEGNVSIEDGVVGQEDLLLAALAQEPLDHVAAIGEGCGLWRRCRGGFQTRPYVGHRRGSKRHPALAAVRLARLVLRPA